LEKQKSKYRSKNSRNLFVDEKEAMDKNILEFKYNNLSQYDEKFKIEVTNDLRVGDARQKFRSLKLQFKTDVVMRRGTDPNTTTHWGHTNQAIAVNKSTNIQHLINDQLHNLNI